MSGDFLVGGTWTNDWRWLTWNYNGGILSEAYPCDCWTNFGGGKTNLWSIAFDPVTEKLYGANTIALYDVNIKNGSQTFIGNFSKDPFLMACITFDENGTLYGWDIKTDNLWTIDTKTAEVSLIGPLGIDISYGLDGAFDLETDTLYLSVCTNKREGQLYTCDKNIGQCTLIGNFQGGANVDAFAIPYTNYSPEFIINGPVNGKTKTVYNYTFSIDYYLGYEPIHLFIDWGDGSQQFEILKPCNPIIIGHSWEKKGQYNISATIEDEYGMSLTAFKEISIPRTKISSKIIFQKMLNSFTMLEKLLFLLF
jgi:hypothetical protein